jgi:hypothetical protein
MNNNHNDAETNLLLQKARVRLIKWKRTTVGLGIALGICVLSVVPFLKGHYLHGQFEDIGKYLILLSMGLLFFFMGAAALTYNFWWYWRKLRAEGSVSNG